MDLLLLLHFNADFRLVTVEALDKVDEVSSEADSASNMVLEFCG